MATNTNNNDARLLRNVRSRSPTCSVVLLFLLFSHAIHGFVYYSSSRKTDGIPSLLQSSQRRSRHSFRTTAIRAANETTAVVQLTASVEEGTKRQSRQQKRAVQIGSTAKEVVSDDDDDSDDEFKTRVTKNSKFLKRNKHWVVLVDDEESIRLAVGDYLYDQGYQVTACEDADAFLDICQRGLVVVGHHHNDDEAHVEAGSYLQQQQQPQPPVPDAIISDVRMPGKDGLQLLGLIRADERLGRVPVILLTAKGLTADRIAGYKAGANVYLPKPFAPEELLSILDNAIQRRKQMTTKKGALVELKQEMANIKGIMKRNAGKVVQKTDVYLTLVEREVLELICRGYTNREIATERGVNIIGVNRTIQKLYRETQAETRTELVRWAYKTGYVSKR